MTALQKQLILCYYDCLNPMDITGIWNDECTEATKKLQNIMDISPSGIWDDDTEKAVKEIFC